MAENVFKPHGVLAAATPDSGGKAPTRTVPLLAIVKDNIDPNRSGRIWVYLSDNSGKDPEDRGNWVQVNFLSTFYGQTIPSANNDNFGTYKNNPNSYGFWHSPPDIGTVVVVLFIDGDQGKGFYLGSIPDPSALQMIPAIGATDNIVANSGEAESYGGAKRLPVANINKNNPSIENSIDFVTAPKPIHSYAAAVYTQQGLIRDTVRGPISSSAQRETPSRVGWGVSTPGRPIYEGGFTDDSLVENLSAENRQNLKIVGRRAGHSIVMDDGDIVGRDQLIRIRSTKGHQILMSDDAQTLFIIHSNGQSYIELGKEGTVDIFSTNSFNVRTQGDLNLHADNNINIHAAKKLNIQSENFHMNTDQDFLQRVGGDYNLNSLGKLLTKVDGSMSFQSAGDSSFASDAITYINGKSKINLNTGSASSKPAEVKPVPIIAQIDTLYDEKKGYAASPGGLLTIVSRAPAHTPWANANQGVDVKVSPNAADNTPQPASQPVEQANQAAQSSSVTPTSVSTSSTVPNVPAVSQAIDKATTSVALSQMAVDAATGPAKDAVKQGIAVVTEGSNKVLAVGAFAMNPQQMEQSGLIKPGSAPLINSLISSGKTPQQSLPSSLFTGIAGVQNLTQLATNVTGQAYGVVRNLQQSQRALQQVGLLSGKESSVQSLGSVMATATQGIAKVTSTIRTVQGLSNIANAAVAGANGNVLGAIAAGTFAASLAQSKVKGLAGINQALGAAGKIQTLGGLNAAAKGIAAAAFDKILGGFKPLKPGVPQNLYNIARQNLVSSIGQASVNTLLGGPSVGGNLSEIAASVASNTLRGATASLASGMSNLPGGLRVAAAVVNNSLTYNTLPGLSNVSGSATNTGTAILNAFSPDNLLSATARTFAPAINPIIGAATNITNIANSFLPKDAQLKSPGALLGLANTGLPQSAVAQLTGALSALNFGGGNPVKMPIIGTETFNRSGLNTQIVSVLGDPKIPPPTFSDYPLERDQAVQALDKQNQKLLDELAERKKVNDRFNKQLEVAKVAKIAWLEAKNSLPEGDPAVAELKQKYDDEVKKLLDIQKEFDALISK